MNDLRLAMMNLTAPLSSDLFNAQPKAPAFGNRADASGWALNKKPTAVAMGTLWCLLLAAAPAAAQVHPTEVHPAPLAVPDSQAATAAEMKPYREVVEHSYATIDLLPIPGGTFQMGSPDSESERGEDEGPRHTVTVDPFWMSKFEITWDAYEVWMSDLDILHRQVTEVEANARDRLADQFQISKPTESYTDMSFGMGKRKYPAICMTQHAARTFCHWLSAKTGRYYRLPTEAEWEYACRAGTTTAYSFGDDVEALDDYSWYYDNSDDRYQHVGQKKPNPWGLYDMHGNVSEWVLDQHRTDFYGQSVDKAVHNPLAVPTTLYPRVVRGGSWEDDPPSLRSAVRWASDEEWKAQDPQIPQSIWYHTDAVGVGFRILRPLTEPTAEEKAAKWDKSDPPQLDAE